MSLMKNFQEEQAARVLSSTTRHTLHQWHQRRTLQRNLPAVDDIPGKILSAFANLTASIDMSYFHSINSVTFVCVKNYMRVALQEGR